MRKVILVFPGAFNPVHNYHIEIAMQSLKQFDVIEKVIFIPVGDKYKKNDLISAKHRYNMLKIACKNNDNLLVSDIELINQKQLYTIETLDIISNENKEYDIWLAIGADNLKEFDTWMKYNKILEKYKVLVISRNHKNSFEILLKNKSLYKYKESFVFLNNDINNISSTQIRNCIKNNLDINNFVPEGIEEYIQQNNIYN